MGKNSLDNAFEFIRTFYNEVAQMLSDINELMAKEGWDPVGSNVYSDTSRSIDNPDDWFPHYVYKNYVNEDEKDSIRGVLILFNWEKYPQTIVFGRANVTYNSNYQWAIWNLWQDNNEIFMKLDGKIKEITGVHDDHPITGKLISISLSEIKSKEDIKKRLVYKLVNLKQNSL